MRAITRLDAMRGGSLPARREGRKFGWWSTEAETPPPPPHTDASAHGPGLASRMVPAVNRAQARRAHVGVDLRRADVRVTEEGLHDAQVGAAVEEMRRERVSPHTRSPTPAASAQRRTSFQTAWRVSGR